MITNKIKFLEGFLGPAATNVSKYNDVLFKCPTQNHNKPKLSVNLDVDDKGSWGKYHCWVCGKDFSGANLISLLRRTNHPELITEFAKDIKGHKWLDVADSINEVSKQINLPEIFIPVSTLLFKNNSKYKTQLTRAYEYLKDERKLTNNQIISNIIGISTAREYYGFIIMPSFDANGELNYFVGRTYVGHRWKYKKCKRSQFEIVFNEVNIDWAKPLLITEGPFDCIKAGTNSTCLLGTAFSKRSLLLKRLIENDTLVLLSLDSDATGRSKSIKISKILTEYGVQFKFIDISSKYKDIAAMPQQDWDNTFENQLANNVVTQEDIILRKIATI